MLSYFKLETLETLLLGFCTGEPPQHENSIGPVLADLLNLSLGAGFCTGSKCFKLCPCTAGCAWLPCTLRDWSWSLSIVLWNSSNCEKHVWFLWRFWLGCGHQTNRWQKKQLSLDKISLWFDMLMFFAGNSKATNLQYSISKQNKQSRTSEKLELRKSNKTTPTWLWKHNVSERCSVHSAASSAILDLACFKT